MGLLKQSTTRNLAFLMVDSVDHLTGKTGLTVAVTLSKDAGAFAAAGGAVTEISSGWYKIALSTTDTNTLGDLALHCTSAGADATDFKEQVVSLLPGDAVTVGTNNDKTGYSLSQAFPANFSSLSIDASGRIDLGKWIGVVPAALSATGAFVQAMLMRWNTDNAGGTPNALISGRVDANAQVVGDKTGYTASTVSDKTGYSLTAGEHTNIATDAQTGLTAQGYTTTRAGYLDTLNGLVQAIWDKATSALSTAGSIGKLLVDNINATISSRLATSGYTTPPTVAQVSTQVWTEPIPGAFGAGSAGAKLQSASLAGDPLATAVPGAYGAGTAGNILGNLPGSVFDVAMASHLSAGSTGQKLNAAGGAAGAGSLTVTITTTDSVTGAPISGVFVWASSVISGNPAAASGLSDANGQVVFFLNAATYYVFRSKAGVNFSNPQTIVVS